MKGMKDVSVRLERCFVELVDRRATEKGMKKGAFAARVWPEIAPKAAGSRWTAIRCKASNTGKPQGVLIADARRMAAVLDVDVSDLVAEAEQNAEKETDPRRS